MNTNTRYINIGPLSLHIREWAGEGQPFVLLHGLASNSQTWALVARRLANAGHYVVAVDQRGHGLSDKPDEGYDFATVSDDLAGLINTMGLERPIVVGQSWGGNVVLAFAARYPALASALGFVDGGFIDFQLRANASWAQVSQELKPPKLVGKAREALRHGLRLSHPDWSDEGIEATLANMETLPDGTIRPWLSLSRHMSILRHLWEQRPQQLYPQVQEPVLIAVARKEEQSKAWQREPVAHARRMLSQVELHWFDETDHDIHVHRPDALADLFLQSLEDGIWKGAKS